MYPSMSPEDDLPPQEEHTRIGRMLAFFERLSRSVLVALGVQSPPAP
jgi:hypothetical protein